MKRKNVKEWSGSLEASRVLPMLVQKTTAVHPKYNQRLTASTEASLPLNIDDKTQSQR
jgi:hypothetical protein